MTAGKCSAHTLLSFRQALVLPDSSSPGRYSQAQCTRHSDRAWSKGLHRSQRTDRRRSPCLVARRLESPARLPGHPLPGPRAGGGQERRCSRATTCQGSSARSLSIGRPGCRTCAAAGRAGLHHRQLACRRGRCAIRELMRRRPSGRRGALSFGGGRRRGPPDGEGHCADAGED
jgi:hypothetical protein